MVEFKRNNEVKSLYKKLHNGKVKIVAGLRQCGKTYLLETLFFNYTKKKHYADETSFLKISMFSEPEVHKTKNGFLVYIKSMINETTKIVFIDEVQEIEEYVDLLIHLAYDYKSVDFYVTGSNSNTLSNDIVDSFKEHADPLFIKPLSFKEIRAKKRTYTIEKYLKFGGIPYIVNSKNQASDIKDLYEKVFRLDIIDRFKNEDFSILSEDDCKSIIENIFISCTAFSVNEFVSKIIKKTEPSNDIKALARKEILDFLMILKQSFLICDIDNEDPLKKTPLEKIGLNKKYYACDCGIAYEYCKDPTHKFPVALETAAYLRLKELAKDPKCFLFVDKERKGREIDFVYDSNLIQVAYRLSNNNCENELNVFENFNEDYHKQLIYVENDVDEIENSIDYIDVESFLLH